ncbi:MAG: LCP family protein [Clostridiales Family XIII bacterium]|jgi:LCP family protein required for cell wall assembly|nr:LCP family protein [Clostridiales Family XIII bacterium]
MKTKHKKPSRFTKRQRIFNKISIVTAVLILIGAGAYIGIDSTLNAQFMKKDPKQGYRSIERSHEKTKENLDILIPAEGMFASEFSDSKRVNVLLLGNTNEGLSDTIMVASFEPDSQRLDIISLPRDTYYERAGYSASFLKLNSVFHEGPHAMAEAVHEILQGIPINYYAVIDYEGIKNIVDSMGGVPMDIKQSMHYTSKDGGLQINFEPGEQVLDGQKSVEFLRFRRYPMGDIGRVEAQQQFLKNAANKALDANIPKVAKTIVDNVDSDITLRAMLYVSSNVSGMSQDNIRSFVLPGNFANVNGLSYWVKKPDADIHAMLRHVYTNGQTAEGSGVKESTYYHEESVIDY